MPRVLASVRTPRRHSATADRGLVHDCAVQALTERLPESEPCYQPTCASVQFELCLQVGRGWLRRAVFVVEVYPSKREWGASCALYLRVSTKRSPTLREASLLRELESSLRRY